MERLGVGGIRFKTVRLVGVCSPSGTHEWVRSAKGTMAVSRSVFMACLLVSLNEDQDLVVWGVKNQEQRNRSLIGVPCQNNVKKDVVQRKLSVPVGR